MMQSKLSIKRSGKKKRFCVCVFHATFMYVQIISPAFHQAQLPSLERWDDFVLPKKNSARDSTPENSIASYIIWTFLDVARHVWDGNFRGIR